MKELIKKTEEKMQKSIGSLENEYKSIRAGRANPAVLDKITVDYYGVPTKIDQMAAVSVPEARMMVIQPWDMSTLSEIQKAILTSDLGLNPSSDGKVLRISFPPLTEERRDSNEKLKAMKKSNEITEDEVKQGEEQIQKLTDKYCKLVDEMVKTKDKEIMEI